MASWVLSPLAGSSGWVSYYFVQRCGLEEYAFDGTYSHRPTYSHTIKTTIHGLGREERQVPM